MRAAQTQTATKHTTKARACFIALIVFALALCGAAALPGNVLAENALATQKWYVRAFNVDDNAKIYVNGNQVASVGYRGDSGWKDITSQVTSGGLNTKLQFVTYNSGGGYTWGYQIAVDNPAGARTILWSQVAGVVGSAGANNNDKSKTNTTVFDQTVALYQVYGNHPRLPIDGSAGSGWFGLTYPGHEQYGQYQYRALDFNCNTPAWDTDRGKTVYAIQDGYVTLGTNNITIKHSQPLLLKNGATIGSWYSMYGHIAPKSGLGNNTFVTKGTPLGTISNRGADNYHLHFVIFQSWSTSDRSAAISPYWLPGVYSEDMNLYADDSKRPTPTRVPAGLYEDRIFLSAPGGTVGPSPTPPAPTPTPPVPTPTPTPPPPSGRQTVLVDDSAATYYGPATGWRISKVGWNGSMHWTWSSTSTLENYAIWRPTLGVGGYEVFAHIPSANAGSTSATYEIYTGTTTATKSINQEPYSNVWVSLGKYTFAAGTKAYVKLADVTGEKSAKMLGFDAIKFVPYETASAPAPAPAKPAPAPAPAPVTTVVAVQDTLNANVRLTRNQSLYSADRRYRFVLQDDGNLVLYGPSGRALWANGKFDTAYAVMQSDGNLVCYRSNNTANWASNTCGSGGIRLVVQTDGNVVVYTSAGRAVWATNTCGKQ